MCRGGSQDKASMAFLSIQPVPTAEGGMPAIKASMG
jgi:hypothetical protein